MIISITKNEIQKYLSFQLDTFFPDGIKCRGKDIDSAIDIALDRTEECFKHILMKGYRTETGEAMLSHLHSDQYSQFLYFFSNSLWNESENKNICDKVICLNKMLNGMFFSYRCHLPRVFLFIHPVGSIIGNADYSDGLVVLQNVTINTGDAELGTFSPKIGRGVYLGAGAKIIGNKPIGDRVTFGENANSNNQEINDDMVILRDIKSGVQIIRERKREKCFAQILFDIVL